MKIAATKTWIAGAVMAAGLTLFALPAMANSAAADSNAGRVVTHTPKPTDVGARRRIRHYTRYADRRYYQPYYIDRPYYYAPAPFFPFLGLGYGPWW
jgi:hypothetical protein